MPSQNHFTFVYIFLLRSVTALPLRCILKTQLIPSKAETKTYIRLAPGTRAAHGYCVARWSSLPTKATKHYRIVRKQELGKQCKLTEFIFRQAISVVCILVSFFKMVPYVLNDKSQQIDRTQREEMEAQR